MARHLTYKSWKLWYQLNTLLKSPEGEDKLWCSAEQAGGGGGKEQRGSSWRKPLLSKSNPLPHTDCQRDMEWALYCMGVGFILLLDSIQARERRRCGGSRVPSLSFIYESFCKMLYAHLTKHKREIELLCRCSEMIDFIALQCAKKSFKTGKSPYNRSQNCTYLTFECSKRIED